MKTLLIFLFSLFMESSLYDIRFQTLSGESIDLSSLADKKILIVPFKPGDSNLLDKLNALRGGNTQLVIIAVPAIELQESENAVESTITSSLVISEPMKVKKNSVDQHPLFAWLTSVSQNTHFDRDVEESGQMFLISKKGTLYAVINSRAPSSLIDQLINKDINE